MNTNLSTTNIGQTCISSLGEGTTASWYTDVSHRDSIVIMHATHDLWKIKHIDYIMFKGYAPNTVHQNILKHATEHPKPMTN